MIRLVNGPRGITASGNKLTFLKWRGSVLSQIRMMAATLEIAKQDPWYTTKEGCSVDHLESMYQRALASKRKMSPAKLGRWLGWMQCVVVCFSPKGYSLDYFKQLNSDLKNKRKRRDKSRTRKVGKGASA